MSTQPLMLLINKTKENYLHYPHIINTTTNSSNLVYKQCDVFTMKGLIISTDNNWNQLSSIEYHIGGNIMWNIPIKILKLYSIEKIINNHRILEISNKLFFNGKYDIDNIENSNEINFISLINLTFYVCKNNSKGRK